MLLVRERSFQHVESVLATGPMSLMAAREAALTVVEDRDLVSRIHDTTSIDEVKDLVLFQKNRLEIA